MARRSMLLLMMIGLGGCHDAQTGPRYDEDSTTRMMSLLMPRRIEIMRSFTRVRSFDENTTPDGIELLVRAVNALDNPGLMVVGEIRVELYDFLPASGDHKGRRVEHWVIDMTTEQAQREHWNRLTQMYEFRLGLDRDRIPRGRKYVLQVTYSSPMGERLADEMVFDFSESIDHPSRLRRRT